MADLLLNVYVDYWPTFEGHIKALFKIAGQKRNESALLNPYISQVKTYQVLAIVDLFWCVKVSSWIIA